jgi:hypothetical protein
MLSSATCTFTLPVSPHGELQNVPHSVLVDTAVVPSRDDEAIGSAGVAVPSNTAIHLVSALLSSVSLTIIVSGIERITRTRFSFYILPNIVTPS